MNLACIFTDHMVFQANQPIRIFGEGEGNVTIRFIGESCKKEFYDDEWCVELSPRQYGGPYKMEIVLDDKTVILNDIYVGEVWLAAGQSNMELPLFRTEYGLEEAKHSYNDKIRFLTLPRRVEKDKPLCGWYFEKRMGEDIPWKICSEESALHFSAIGYYAAKELQEKLGCAVGIIDAAWGGVPIETFIKREYFNKVESLKPIVDEYNEMVKNLDWDDYLERYHSAVKKCEVFFKSMDYDEIEDVRQKGVRATIDAPRRPLPHLPADGPFVCHQPGLLYDSMISRIIPFALAGILWYQGESNKFLHYSDKYLLLMECFRNDFKCKNMPFYAIELASFGNFGAVDAQESNNRFIEEDNWALLREEQHKAVDVGENNYLITSMGLGDLYDIHPIHKKELAHRMVLKILKYTYGFDIYADQPIYKSSKFEDSKVIIELENSEGLYSCSPKGVNIFVADETKQLKKAKFEIKNDMLIVICDEVKKPMYVHYGFDYGYLGCHIFNKAGLPLSPFRCKRN